VVENGQVSRTLRGRAPLPGGLGLFLERHPVNPGERGLDAFRAIIRSGWTFLMLPPFSGVIEIWRDQRLGLCARDRRMNRLQSTLMRKLLKGTGETR